MANKRMFSKRITTSDAFLDMPVSSQLLYFHLNMEADDDGFVGNPKRIMRTISVGTDDLKILLTKRFILSFESGVIVIKHWLLHNAVRKDMYQETQYIDEKKSLKIKDNGAYTEVCNVSVTLPLHRLDKDRLDKDIDTVANATTWNFEEELKKLKESKRKDYKIIALYWKKKNFVFENKEQFNAALLRELKPAKMLKGYTGEQIAKSIAYCEKEYEVWTLETIFKRITDLVNTK